MDSPLHIAVVGSGPSGFYAAEALLRSQHVVHVSMLERLPAPYGLVRYGVAPDHQKLKKVISVFDRIAAHERFTYFGNVALGRDVTIEELKSCYHAVVLACGAPRDRQLGITGESMDGCHAATDFVGWYNGHPDFRDKTFNFDCETAVIIGQGNVAADVCRILTMPPEELRKSDISAHALEELAKSKIRNVHIVGRRGPVQAKFSPAELRELDQISDVSCEADPVACEIGPACLEEVGDKSNPAAAKNFDLFRRFSTNRQNDAGRRITFQFCLEPTEIFGDGSVTGVRFTQTALQGAAHHQKAVATDNAFSIDCGIVFKSIGYKGVALPGLPFDDKAGVVPNEKGRVVASGASLPGVYVTGWQKRGPTGIIGSNRADSIETIESLMTDMSTFQNDNPKEGAESLAALLQQRDVRFINIDDWRIIDRLEIERGMVSGKPREKFAEVDEMIDVLSCSVPEDRQAAKAD